MKGKRKTVTTTSPFFVYQNGIMVDTVFYSSEITSQYVKKELIEHDGYPHDIVVVKERTT